MTRSQQSDRLRHIDVLRYITMSKLIDRLSYVAFPRNAHPHLPTSLVRFWLDDAPDFVRPMA